MANHLRFLGRTVMVQNGNVEAAYGALNRWGGPRWAGGGCLLSRGWGEPRSSAESRLPDKDPGGVGRVLLIKLGIISYAQGLSFSSGLSLVTTGGLPPILPP